MKMTTSLVRNPRCWQDEKLESIQISDFASIVAGLGRCTLRIRPAKFWEGDGVLAEVEDDGDLVQLRRKDDGTVALFSLGSKALFSLGSKADDAAYFADTVLPDDWTESEILWENRKEETA